MQTSLSLDQSVPLNPMFSAGETLPAGFRLERFEALNWGTFHQRPWSLVLEGETALLTGDNGSGKSTLVDGMLTLLVSNVRRSYNLASSAAGKKKERDEKSYVQGAYGRTRSEEAYGSKTKLLREKDELSVLLAHFKDSAAQKSVTLAQVLWIENGGIRKFFAIAPTELTIADHFSQVTSISELKKRLQVDNIETFDQFSHYSLAFRKRLGFRSEQALDLFNQTVSIKEIGGLNGFVRNHMLEKIDVQTKIQELQESYENLTLSHTAIQKARKQLEALEPLTKAAKRYTKLELDVSALLRFQLAAPVFFAGRKLDLLVDELKAVEENLLQVQHRTAAGDRLLETLQTQAKDLEFALKQNEAGQRLQALTDKIAQQQKLVDAKKQQAKEYDRLAVKLDLAEYSDQGSFYAARAQAEALQQEMDEALQTLETKRDEQKVRESELQKRQRELSSELSSLRSRKSQIPTRNLEIRDRLAQALSLNSSELPFIGELLQVRAEEKAWEGAIERLLRGFGLCILVPQAHYQAVNTYVNKTHLQGRVVYYRVASNEPDPTQRSAEPGCIPHKLRIKPDSEAFSQWLKDRLVQQFNYVCCDSIGQFQRETRAITPTGLIKHCGDRHEKDDRSKLGDRSQYVLGWDNANKIKALEAELQQVEVGISHISGQIRMIERQQKKKRQQGDDLRDFMKIANYAEIDWRSAERDRLDLEKQKQDLEASSDQLKQLKQQLQTTQTEIAEAKSHRDLFLRESQTLADDQRKNKEEQARCKAILQADKPDAKPDIKAFETGMAADLKQCVLTLKTIADDESSLKETIQAQLTKKRDQLNSAQSVMEKCMLSFRNDFPESTLELGTTKDDLDEYLALKAQIEQDDLPQHEKRFKQMMDDKIVTAILIFKSSLEQQEEAIKIAIDNINASLQQIDYTDSTYIALRCDNTRNREIRDFEEDLKVCIGDVARQSAEDHEQRFQDIRTRLIEKFKSGDRWTKLVTDVRNWLDFSVSERYRADDTEKEHHTDSSGKSGGQKVKLAYTILASAIAYQFGLSHSLELESSKSFRFVVIDEAFSKSDDSNARYAMNLFKNLQLQLLVITPKDKINVIESYISSIHLVSNRAEGNYSRVDPISIEKYRQERQQALAAES